ncbi:cytochrome b-c1 complex, subunit 10 [Rhodotorula toruloides]|uniref:Cytochrome b-c1 complex, subunit 10 n=1 Tax=Rhodotorula toruloides TaxID=5286 RepID=A0A511KPQ5_RHOTO|nr:cytochrome b-c1 complex, subunit 10 [Rhodotorula toruloides]
MALLWTHAITISSCLISPRVQVLKPGRAVLGFTPAFVGRLVPNLALWSFAGAGVLFLAGSSIPLFQTDVLKKLPVVANYYEDKTPDSDKPF